MPPVRVTGLADRGGERQRRGGLGLAQEAQAGFVRETVGLEGNDFLLRPNEVLERVAAATVTRDYVIEIAALRTDEFAGVLADAPFTGENRGARNARHARLGLVFVLVAGSCFVRRAFRAFCARGRYARNARRVR